MKRSFAALSVALVSSALSAACDKPEPPAPAPAPAVSSVASPVVSASAAPAVSTAAMPAGSGSSAAADCGGKDNPCPLQGWMRENVNPPMNKKDMPALAVALDKIAAFAPAGYANWKSISIDGAAAARNGDMDAAKASCRSCHDQYKQKYKTELRGRKI